MTLPRSGNSLSRSVGLRREDPLGRHRIGCCNAADHDATTRLLDGHLATLAIYDPPYNVAAFEIRGIAEFMAWCATWLRSTALCPPQQL